MSQHFIRSILLATTAIAGGVSLPALAQLAPPAPVRQSVDGNGVDLFLGTMNITAPALTIGQGEPQGLSYFPVNRGSGWADNISAFLYLDSGFMIVSLGGISDKFSVAGTTYTATQGNGATLTYNSGTKIYTYTRADGTIVRFDEAKATASYYYSNGGRAIDMVTPSGAKLTYSYDSINYCSRAKEGSSGYICTGHSNAFHLDSVRSSYGYRMTFNYGPIQPYDPDDIFDLPDFATWSTPLSVTATNLAVASGASTPTETFGYSSSGGTTYYNVTDALSRQTIYRMSGQAVTGVTRPGSSSEDATIAYSGGKVSSFSTSAGTTSYAYSDTLGVRTTTVTDPLTHVWTYQFDIAAQRMTGMTDPLSHTTNWAYDSDGRVTRIVQPEGHTTPESDYTEFEYDDRGNVKKKTIVPKLGSGLGNIVTSATFPATCGGFGINPASCNQPITSTDANGNVTSYTYDLASGGVETVTSPPVAGETTGPITHFSYTSLQAYFKNGSGSIVASGEPVYRLTKTWACRTTIGCAETSANASVSAIDYGPQTVGTGNNLLPVNTSAGAGDGSLTAVTSYGYDDIGNAITVDGPLAGTNDITRKRYDAARQVTGVIGPNPQAVGYALKNRAARLTYDLKGRVTKGEQGTVNSQSDSDWTGFTPLQTVETTYNGLDQKMSDTVSAGGFIYGLAQYSYDAASRLDCSTVRMTDLMLATPPIAACTQTTGATTPDRITKQYYNDANQVTSVQTGYGTALVRADSTATYTANGKTATVKDANNNLTTYEYDGFDRLAKTRYPSPTTPNSSSTTDYTQPTYDPNGNVTAIRLRDSQSIALTYDARNQMTAKNLPGSEPDVAYSYDLNGRMTGASQTGNALTFSYDALGRNLTQAGPQGTVSYQYDLAGRKTRTTWPDSFYVTYDHLLTGEMSAVRENGATSGAGVLGLYYYDDLGNRTGLIRGNGTSSSYGYDMVARLTGLTNDLASTAKDLTLSFSYNAASQITARTVSNDAYAFGQQYMADRSYTTNGLNQYTQAGSKLLTYDGRGNLTAVGDKAYGYSSENYLTSGPGVALSYDPMGRLYQTVGTATTKLAYDGQDLIALYDGSDVLKERYVHGPGTDEVLAMYDGSGAATRNWLHSDERGSVIGISDGSGSSIATNAYDEYGVPQTSNVGRFQYTGQTWISELGMYYYKARFYEPKLGRFMQTDPIGYGGGMNLYAYAGNDPVNHSDPTGNDPFDIIITGPSLSSFGLDLSWLFGSNFGLPDLSGLSYLGGISGYPATTVTTPMGDAIITALHNCGYYSNCDGIIRGLLNSLGASQPGYGGFSGLTGGSAPQKMVDDPGCAGALREEGQIDYEATVGTLIVGGGITGSSGTFRNAATGTTGSFFSLGGGGGAELGVTQVSGTARSLALLNGGGVSLNVGVGLFSYSANASLGKKSVTTAGDAAGYGAGGLALGVSGTMTGTKLYGCKVKGK